MVLDLTIVLRNDAQVMGHAATTLLPLQHKGHLKPNMVQHKGHLKPNMVAVPGGGMMVSSAVFLVVGFLLCLVSHFFCRAVLFPAFPIVFPLFFFRLAYPSFVLLYCTANSLTCWLLHILVFGSRAHFG